MRVILESTLSARDLPEGGNFEFSGLDSMQHAGRNTVFLCMLPWVLVQQVSYTLARERAYFPQNGVGGAQGRCVVPTDWAPTG